MADIAISVRGVYKDFTLPHEKNTTIKSRFTSLGKSGKKSNATKQHALKDISFDVKRGEFFGIVGRNGSGKSTLLKMLAGIYQPTKGEIAVGGKIIPFIELGVGFNPELSGRDNVYLNGALLGFSTTEIDLMYDEIVAFAELEKFMDQKLKNYSSGMQVRLAFSMVVKAEADILLVDEVLAVGDADFQRKCFEYFKLLKKNKKTVIFVSHDMDAVREYCDRAILIEKSELKIEGSSDKIALAYTKMFIEKNNDAQDSSELGRWGDGALQFSNPKVSATTLTDSDEQLILNVDVLALQRIEKPVFGFSVTGPSGIHLLGTNTKLKKIKPIIMEKDQSFNLEWNVSNVFNQGTHYINLAAVYQNGKQVADWWDEAVIIRVIREEKNPYVILPVIGVKIEGGL